MFCRLGLIRDVKVIMVQGGRPCAGALGLRLFAVSWLGGWIHQYSDGSFLRGYRVTGEIWNGEGRLELESNALGLCVICEPIPFWWAQQMMVRVLIAFQIWWAWVTSKLCTPLHFQYVNDTAMIPGDAPVWKGVKRSHCMPFFDSCEAIRFAEESY